MAELAWESARRHLNVDRVARISSVGTGTGSVAVIVLGVDGKELGRGRFFPNRDAASSKADPLEIGRYDAEPAPTTNVCCLHESAGG